MGGEVEMGEKDKGVSKRKSLTPTLTMAVVQLFVLDLVTEKSSQRKNTAFFALAQIPMQNIFLPTI